MNTPVGTMRRINGYLPKLIALFFACLIVLKDLFSGRPIVQKPRIFYRTYHVHRIFPSDSRLMEVERLPYVLGNDLVCAKTHHVIIVHSSVGNFDRRKDLRETWASPNVLETLDTKLVFIVGLPRDNGIQSQLIKENNIYHDIVQGDFVDDYTNLTLKAVTGLRWVTENCFNASTVFKLDDDVFLDIYKAIDDIVPLLYYKPRQLICSAEPKGIIFRSGSAAHLTKWKIPDKFFPGQGYYPMPFCYGFGVFMSGQVAHELFQLSKATPFFRLDDVFMYGLLANKVEGLSWRSEDAMFTQDPDFTLSIFRQKPRRGGLLLGTVRFREAALELWELTREIHACNNSNSHNSARAYC